MLDIGFTELLLVAAIALVVLGPERLPQAIKVTAYWVGKIRRSFQSVKEELEREIGADDIKRQIHNEAVMQELSKARDQFQAEVRDLEQATGLKTEPVPAQQASFESGMTAMNTKAPEAGIPSHSESARQQGKGEL